MADKGLSRITIADILVWIKVGCPEDVNKTSLLLFRGNHSNFKLRSAHIDFKETSRRMRNSKECSSLSEYVTFILAKWKGADGKIGAKTPPYGAIKM